MKKCSKCNLEKEYSLYWKCKTSLDGYRGACKECSTKARKEKRIPEREKLYARRSYLKHRESRIERQLKYEKNLSFEKDLVRKEKKRLAYRRSRLQKDRKRFYQKNIYDSTKLKANAILNFHIRRGDLIRPKNCSICGDEKKLDGHHADYNKPLDVIWVCRFCHKNIHKSIEEKQYGSQRNK